MIRFDVREWPAISALFDEALDLPAAQRRQWLEALPADQSSHKPALELLLANHAHVETGDFLSVLPRVGIVADPAQPGDGTCTVGPYRLLREIGRGGMGTVWLAERADGVLKRQVALKLPHPGLATPAFAERLARERDILAALTHPNIARLYDAGVSDDGRPYIALAYVPGRTLIDHARESDLDTSARIELFLQVLNAVQYAHSRLVIHRDLKPSNVLVDESGTVHLLDFGIAKLMVDGSAEATALTLDAGLALTPDYASPEQISGEGVTIASDVYALGVLLYELLTDQHPYRLPHVDRSALLGALLALEITPPSAMLLKGSPGGEALTKARRQRARDVRGDLDTIVLTALKLRPELRYATVQALQADLQRHVAGEAVLARSEGRASRLWRFARRHRLPVAAGTVVLLAVLGGSGVALWEAARARDQARRAEAQAQALGGVGDFMMRTFSRLAASSALAGSVGHQLLGDAMRVELQRAETANRGNPQAMAAVAGHAAAMFNYIGEQPETLVWAERQLQLLRDAGEPPNSVGESERLVALGYYRGGDYEKSLAHLRAGLELVKPAADEDTRVLRARLWRASGNALTSLGRFPDARDALEAARQTLSPDLREDKQYYGAACIDLARVYDELDDPPRAQALLDEVRVIFARQPGLPDSEMGGLEWGQGVLDLNRGHYAKAEASLRRSAQLYAVQYGTESPNAAGIDALIALAVGKQGRVGEAEVLLDHALPILRRGSSWRLLERALHARAEIELDHARLEQAAPAVAEIRAHVQGRPTSELWAMLFEARLALASGQRDRARAEARRAEELCAKVFKSSPRLSRTIAEMAREVERAAAER